MGETDKYNEKRVDLYWAIVELIQDAGLDPGDTETGDELWKLVQQLEVEEKE